MRTKPLALAIAAVAPLSAVVPWSAVAQEGASILESVQPYGLFKPFLSFDETDKVLVSQSTNRLGVRVDEPFANKVRAFGQAEFGINLVNNNQNATDVSSPRFGGGGEILGGEVNVNFPVFTRLGYVALIPSWGSFSIGKQWGVYYDVAGFTDWFPLFGGEATGVYTGGDGGVNGTGRAGQAFQFRTSPFDINIGLQIQARSVSETGRNTGEEGAVEDKDVADTYGASVTYNIKITEDMNLVIGAAYNRADGGASSPDDVDYGRDIPLKNTYSVVGGLDFYWRKFRIAFTYAYLDQSDIDDEGFPFRGNGYELYSRYTLSDSWYVYGGGNYLDPDDYNLHQRGEDGRFVNTGRDSQYEIKYIDVGINYQFAKTSGAYIELKIEDSENADGLGSRARPSTLAFGFEFAFGY